MAGEPPPVLDPVPGHRIAAVLAVLDAAVFGAVFLLAHGLGWTPAGSWTGNNLSAALGVGLALGVFALFGLYDPGHAARGWLQGVRLLRGWAVLLGTGFLIAVMNRGDSVSLYPMLLLSLGVLGAGAIRLTALRTWLVTRHVEAIRGASVIVGTGPLARRMAGAWSKRKDWEPRLVGFVDDPGPFPSRPARPVDDLPAPYLGGLDQVRELAREHRISHVLVAREDLSRGRLVELAHQWLEDDLKVSLVSSAFEVMVARASASLMGGLPLAILQQSPQRGWGLRWKRLLDVGLVTLGGIVLLPLLGVIAVAIKATSSGPVLYKQQRIGRNGRVFTLFKFRSMLADNDDRPHREYVEALIRGEPAGIDVGGEKVYKLVNDPRITPLGRFLRATSLDEFPQLWNVLLGDMSLVGPRPCLPYEWELYEDWQRARLKVLPGITGLWQVSGRSQVPFEEMVLLDLHYIANWSLSLDLALLFRTVPVVLNGSGGH